MTMFLSSRTGFGCCYFHGNDDRVVVIIVNRVDYSTISTHYLCIDVMKIVYVVVEGEKS